MALITYTIKLHALRMTFVQKRDQLIERLIPRRSTIVCFSMILGGLTIPALMMFEVLPLTLWWFFAGITLVSAGSISALIFCGEI